MNKPEILSFTYQEIYLSRILIQSRNHLIEYIKFLSKKYNLPANKIIFHHDLDDNDFKIIDKFKDNFKVNNSYDWTKIKKSAEVLK